MAKLEPAIKWSGSKRTQAENICSYITKNYETYYELFCGGCSVLYYILNNCPDRFNRYVCNDINEPLIELYKLIKSNYLSIQSTYEHLWLELNKNTDLERKKEYFNKTRSIFNESKDPKLLFFIMRTTTNGMPRYNKKGDFNNSFHVTRNGMNPMKIRVILANWSSLLNKYNVEFYSDSYENYKVNKNDLLYLDPPYYNTKGMYYGTIDYDNLWDYLKNNKADWLLSFNGKAGEKDNTVSIPKIYKKHVYLDSGNSSFRRVTRNSKNTNVKESLYIKIKQERENGTNDRSTKGRTEIKSNKRKSSNQQEKEKKSKIRIAEEIKEDK